ncbi:MAG: hypothetical protein J6T69_01430 [Methanobrevibacter sp.]|nr:hypothetical protein [Methanobrevibacter sp.]
MPARLGKQPNCSIEPELRISVKSLLFIAFLCILFFAFCFIVKGPTYGIL